MKTATRISLAAVIAAALIACGGDAAPQGSDGVVDAWKVAGLEPGDMATLDDHQLGDARCKRGAVSGVETTLCTYAAADAAAAARSAGLEMVGETTGAALSRDAMLLVVADRSGADPKGRTINKITRVFLGK